MLLRLLCLFAALFTGELLVLLRVGKAWGFWPTVLLLVAAAWSGLLLLRRQKARMAIEIRSGLAAGGLPSQTLFDGATLALAGGLLILPGFLSDAMALILLLPVVRRWFGRVLGWRLAEGVRMTGFWSFGAWPVEPVDSPDDRFSPERPGLRPGAKYVRNEALDREEA